MPVFASVRQSFALSLMLSSGSVISSRACSALPPPPSSHVPPKPFTSYLSTLCPPFLSIPTPPPSSPSTHLLILTQPIHEPLPRRHKLPKLPAHHILANLNLTISFSVVDREAETDEVGQDGGGAGLRADGGEARPLGGGGGEVGGAGDGEAGVC